MQGKRCLMKWLCGNQYEVITDGSHMSMCTSIWRQGRVLPKENINSLNQSSLFKYEHWQNKWMVTFMKDLLLVPRQVAFMVVWGHTHTHTQPISSTQATNKRMKEGAQGQQRMKEVGGQKIKGLVFFKDEGRKGNPDANIYYQSSDLWNLSSYRCLPLAVGW